MGYKSSSLAFFHDAAHQLILSWDGGWLLFSWKKKVNRVLYAAIAIVIIVLVFLLYPYFGGEMS